jgi:superfamily II DNA or RNA helicase
MPNLYFFSVNKKEKYVYVPRGYLYIIHKRIHELGLKHKVTDRTVTFNEMNFKFNGKARDYQDLAIKDVLRYPLGVLQGSTGCGKTFMGVNLIQKRQQPTLVIVHSKELLDQWRDEIQKLLGINAGTVGGGKFDIQPVTVGIVNSVKNRTEELRERFGHIILDECHRSPSTMWTETLGRFPAKYYLGLSATVFRQDGLGGAINAFIGPTIHRVDKEHLHKTGAVLKPKIIRVPTDFTSEPRTEYSTIIASMVRDIYRNDLIVNKIMDDITENNAPVLVVSDRVNHCKTLTQMLEREGYKVSLLISAKTKNERIEAVEDIRNGVSSILIATVQIISEGFDAPNLHSLFLTTPMKYAGRVIQVVGRILRPAKGKTARVYDFRDDNIWMLRASGKKRDKVYKGQWG